MMKDFINFIREQGVIGLAVGFILGGAVSKVVSALVTDIINPIISIVTGAAGNMKDMILKVGPVKLMWGDFLNTLIDFLVVSAVVYMGVRILKLDRLDKKKT